jgi:hypothetical protein
MDKQGWHDSLGVQDGNVSEQCIATVGLPPLRIAGQTGWHRPIPVSAIKPTRWLQATKMAFLKSRGGVVLGKDGIYYQDFFSSRIQRMDMCFFFQDPMDGHDLICIGCQHNTVEL